MEVRGKHRIPEPERPPKSLRPTLGRVDLDPDIPEIWLSQIIVFGARSIGARPIRQGLLRISRTLRSPTEPYCYDARKKLFALAHAAAHRACSLSAIMSWNCTNG
jgi:hypothetical protein